MKRKIKKVFYIYICFVIVSNIICNITVFANSQHIYSKDKKVNKVFKELVKKGLPEEDLYALSEDEIEQIKNTNPEDISVCVRYYRVPSVDEQNLEANKTSTSGNEEIELLTDEEVAGLLESLDQETNDEYSFSLNPFPIRRTKAKAVMNDKYSSDGYLRHTLIITSFGSRKYSVSFTAYWLKQPKKAQKDVIGLSFSNATYIQGTASGYTRFFYQDYSKSGLSVLRSGKEDFKMKDFTCTGGEIASWGDLSRNSKTLSDGFRVYSTADFLHINCDVLASKVEDVFSASSKYLHQETKKVITPSFSISGGGPSASISVANVTSYKAMTPNAYLSIRY